MLFKTFEKIIMAFLTERTVFSNELLKKRIVFY